MSKPTTKSRKDKIIIYKTAKNGIELKVRLEGEAVWLRQNEIADLFGKDRSVITRHINNIFNNKEADKKSNVHFLHIANSDKPVAFYSLDVILAVGYRTNSSRAIHFRKWATEILKQYLIKGYAVNEQRLLETREKFKELQSAITFLQEKSKKELLKGQEGELLNLLSGYARTLTLLEEYDKGEIKSVHSAARTCIRPLKTRHRIYSI